MTEEFIPCDLISSPPISKPGGTVNSGGSRDQDLDQPIFSVFSGGVKQRQVGEDTAAMTSPTETTTDAESGIFSVGGELCAEHESELDWFCGTDQKSICSQCFTAGSCRGHSVTPLAARVAAVRNQLVDVCEKIQLQALRIEKFIDQTLTVKEQKLQTAANRARDQVLAQVNAAREALEEEEQRLLEEVQREEERVEQCLLTQRAHWNQALASLSQTRSSLVHTLTHMPDTQLVMTVQDIAERVEEAEGVGEPCDTEQLNLNPACSESKLLRGLWATAVLLGPNARQSVAYDPARFDCWPNALGLLSMSSGTHSWAVDVGQSAAFKVGVCYASLERKGSGNEARLGFNSQSWVLSHYDGVYSFCHEGRNVPLQIVKRPQKIGLLLDWPSQTLMFYELDSSTILYSITHRFDAPLLPACAVTDRSITILH
ncbi:B box and SPRY domain-containing protein isoform X2 [Antennarius striatus]|uniref:B box and SPRY domain-containing protein isoform X2 n=1 Tax=Antennarius striatus TaxID=241820 RepID=UPI0035B2980F